MTIIRMDHVGIVVDDMEAAIDFFLELGLVSLWTGSVEGDWVGRIIGLEDVHSDVTMLQTPDGHSRVELSSLRSPAHVGDRDLPANARGLRHLCFAVTDLDDIVARLQRKGYGLVGELLRFEDSYRLCYVRGPEGVIVELAEAIG